MKNDFFCVLPWTEIFVEKTQARPCCVYKPTSQITVDSYSSSKEIDEVKSKFLNGEIPQQCRGCYENEKKMGYSTRVSSNFNQDEAKQKIIENRWKKNHFQNIHILTSNVCNLKCLPCENASYSRDLELKSLRLKINTPKKFVIDDCYKTLLNYSFERITLLGGEPFYDKKTIEIIDFLIENNKSKEIILLINSNFTHIDDSILLKLNNNFCKIILKASIDGIGKKNDYLRFPSNWEKIEENVRKAKKYPNIELVLTTALSNLSLIGYHEIVKWALQENIHYLYCSIVEHPSVLNPKMLPVEIKKSLIPKLEKLLEIGFNEDYKTLNREKSIKDCINSCLQICKDDKNYSLERTKQWITLHDNFRKNSMLEAFPELKPYW